MRLTKSKFVVRSIAPFRDHQLEGEAEGKLGKQLRVRGTLPYKKCAGLYRNKDTFALGLGNLYDENGALLSEDEGKKSLTVEGVCCKATVLFGLTDTHEFEEVVFDCISVTPEKGGMVTVDGRLRLHPEVKQLAKIDQWLKNEVILTVNGETVSASAEDEAQEELELGGPKEDDDTMENEGIDDDPPAAGPGEVLPGVPAQEPAAHAESLKDLREAGVLSAAKGAVKPSLAHGKSEVEGRPPPQRPRRRPTLQ